MDLGRIDPMMAVVTSVRRVQLDDGLVGFAGTVVFQFEDIGEATPRASVTVATECPWTATYEDVERRLVDTAFGAIKQIADLRSVAEEAGTEEDLAAVDSNSTALASDLDNQ